MSAAAMDDEYAAWDRTWSKVKNRGARSSDLATMLVERAFSGHSAGQLLDVLECAGDEERLGDAVFGAFRLCAAIARRNRTVAGLMGITAALHDTADQAPNWRTRAAARLLLAYEIVDDVLHFEDTVGLDTGSLHDIGAHDYNQTLSECGEFASIAVIEALGAWRVLLPEVTALTVKNVAATLWSNQ